MNKTAKTDSDLPAGLYIIATPIGNIRDITLRALDVLGKVDAIACEDTRVTGKLTSTYDIKAPKIPYHDHNAEKTLPRLISMLKEGQRIALVSDAGMPLVSDPGYRLVTACIEQDIPITCLPGASASLTALALSGLPAERFFFAGFLPPKSAARKTALTEIKDVPSALIFYETAPRLVDSLQDMLIVLGDRPAAVARELTKKFEEVRRGKLSALIAHYREKGPPKGEIAIVVGRPEKGQKPVDPADIDKILLQLMKDEGLSVKDAARRAADETGGKKRDLYQRALELSSGEEDDD